MVSGMVLVEVVLVVVVAGMVVVEVVLVVVVSGMVVVEVVLVVVVSGRVLDEGTGAAPRTGGAVVVAPRLRIAGRSSGLPQDAERTANAATRQRTFRHIGTF